MTDTYLHTHTHIYMRTKYHFPRNTVFTCATCTEHSCRKACLHSVWTASAFPFIFRAGDRITESKIENEDEVISCSMGHCCGSMWFQRTKQWDTRSCD